METKTTELRGSLAMQAIFLISAARCGKIKVTPDFYGWQYKARALLVDPLNESPFVLVDVSEDPKEGFAPLPIVRRIEFVPAPRSGTDKLRARIEARLFLDQVPADGTLMPADDLKIVPLRDGSNAKGPSQTNGCRGGDLEKYEADSSTQPGL